MRRGLLVGGRGYRWVCLLFFGGLGEGGGGDYETTKPPFLILRSCVRDSNLICPFLTRSPRPCPTHGAASLSYATVCLGGDIKQGV